VPRYRLRHQGSDLEMPAGDFVVGRSSQCNLALDDALVSRRHAIFRVKPEGVWVEDLGSRNGVAVNGERITGPTKVGHLERVTIGAHEMVVLELSDGPDPAFNCEVCGTALPALATFCARCGNPVGRGSPTLVGMTLEIPAAAMRERAGGGVSEEHTAQALLAGIADKALALGRFEEAERVLGKSMAAMLARARAGEAQTPARVAEATRYALRLAEGTKKPSWLDWVFEMHEVTGRLLGADDIERLHEVVRKLRYTNGSMVRRYLDKLRAKAGELSAADRFLLQRLEGIERVVTA
jgi:hypothetical protein